MSAGLKDIVVKFVGDTLGLEAAAEGASKSIEGVSKSVDSGTGKWDKFSKAAGAAGLVLAGGLLAGLKVGIDNVEALAESNDGLETTLKNMPNSFGLTTKALDAQAEALQGTTTFSRDQILAADQLILKNDALQTMMKNGSLTQQQAATDVLNLATVMKTDASSAATTYAKILSNPFSATKQLTAAGVVLTQGEQDKIKAWKKSGDVADAQKLILGKLEDKTKDAAEAAGKTLPAKLDQAKKAFGDAAGQLTTQLIPALDTVVGWLGDIAKWATDNPGQFKLVVSILGGLAGVLIAVGVATKIWAAYQAILDAAMALNPLGIVVLAVAALVGGLIIAYKTSGTFRDIVKAAFDTVKDAVQAVWDFIKNNWPLLLGILTGPIGLAVVEIVKHWDSIKSGAKDAWNGIKSAFSSVGSFFAGVGDSIANGIKGGINAAIDVVNFFIRGLNEADAISFLGHRIGAPSIPTIPHMANGGMANGLTWVGERGPELVKLPGGSQVVPNDKLGGGSTTTQVFSGGQDITQFVTSIVTKNTRATRNAVRAGASRAFV